MTINKMANNSSDVLNISRRCFLYNPDDEGSTWGHCCEELSIVPKPWWVVFVLSLPIEAVLAGADVRATKAMYAKKKSHTALIFVVYNLLSLSLLSYEYFVSNTCDTNSVKGAFECYQGLIFMFYNSTAALATLTLWMMIIMRKYYIYMYWAARQVIWIDAFWNRYDSALKAEGNESNLFKNWTEVSKDTGLYWYNKLLMTITLIFGGLTHVLPLFFVYPYIMFSLVFAMVYSHSLRLAYLSQQSIKEKRNPPTQSRKNFKSVFLSIFVFYPVALLVTLVSIFLFVLKPILLALGFLVNLFKSCSTVVKVCIHSVCEQPVQKYHHEAADYGGNLPVSGFMSGSGGLHSRTSSVIQGTTPPAYKNVINAKNLNLNRDNIEELQDDIDDILGGTFEDFEELGDELVNRVLDKGRVLNNVHGTDDMMKDAGEINEVMTGEKEFEKMYDDLKEDSEVQTDSTPENVPELSEAEANPIRYEKKSDHDQPYLSPVKQAESSCFFPTFDCFYCCRLCWEFCNAVKPRKVKGKVFTYMKDILRNLAMYDPDGRLIMVAASTTFLCFTLSANYALLFYSNAPYERIPVIDSNARTTAIYFECTTSNFKTFNAFGLVDFLGLALTGAGALLSFGEFLVSL
mmetsp:Transcript_5683/g.6723  ORF Transcript_5683/g.6723 Transcript_5683/m.6723 type:complete len:630 (+) Transcript_5683:229-2118(+)